MSGKKKTKQYLRMQTQYTADSAIMQSVQANNPDLV